MEPLDADRITQLVIDHWRSLTLLTLNELNVFGLLDSGPLPAPRVAAQLGADARGVELLLNAGVRTRRRNSSAGWRKRALPRPS